MRVPIAFGQPGRQALSCLDEQPVAGIMPTVIARRLQTAASSANQGTRRIGLTHVCVVTHVNIVGNIFRGTADGLSITFGDSSSLVGRALAYGSTITTANTSISVPTCEPFETPIPAEGEVALGKNFGPTIIAAGGISTLTVTLSNNNLGVATLTSPLSDTLPDGVVVAPTPNAITTCGLGTPTAIAGASTVSLPTGTTIPGGVPGTCALVVDVTAPGPGAFVNTLDAGALQTDEGSNANPANAVLNVIAPIGIPTLSQWTMILLAFLLAIVGFRTMRSRAVRY